jgi:uncharacterized membrane protein affecting hemolysin expression
MVGQRLRNELRMTVEAMKNNQHEQQRISTFYHPFLSVLLLLVVVVVDLASSAGRRPRAKTVMSHSTLVKLSGLSRLRRPASSASWLMETAES